MDAYVGELRTLALSCNFCTCLRDTLVRYRIVLGIRDGGTRKRLLCQGKLTLQKGIEIAKSDEVSNTQLNMDQTTPEDVHKVNQRYPPKKPEHKYPKQAGRNNPKRKPNDDKMSTSNKPCDFCGKKHCRGRANCATWGRVCVACGKKNHFTSQCKAKEKTHNVEVEEGPTSKEEFLYCVTSKPEMTGTVNSASECKI